MTFPPFTFNAVAIVWAVASTFLIAIVASWAIRSFGQFVTLLRDQREADQETARRQRLDRIFQEKWRTR